MDWTYEQKEILKKIETKTKTIFTIIKIQLSFVGHIMTKAGLGSLAITGRQEKRGSRR